MLPKSKWLGTDHSRFFKNNLIFDRWRFDFSQFVLPGHMIWPTRQRRDGDARTQRLRYQHARVDAERRTEGELETYGYAEYEKLQRAHGPELDTRLQAAARMIDQLEQQQPSLKNLLKSKGVGDSAMLASSLIAHLGIYHAHTRR